MKDLQQPRPIPLRWALLPIAVSMTLLLITVVFLSVPIYLSLLTGFLLAGIVALKHGWRIQPLLSASYSSVKALFPVFLILFLVGGMISVWIVSGTVSSLIFYGLTILPPQLMVLSAFIMCTIISMLVGTSIGTLSTVGVAFMSMAAYLDISLGLMGGALISGAFIGDRTSPLSSSLHLNASSSGTSPREMMPHLYATLWPVVLILLFAYSFAGRALPDSIQLVVDEKKQMIWQSAGGIYWWMLIPPATILMMALFRQSTVRTLSAGLAAGSLVALTAYDVPLLQWLDAMMFGSTVPSIDNTQSGLGTVGGMLKMVEQLLIILVAGALYGVIETSGMLKTSVHGLIKHMNTPKRLVQWTGVVSLGAGAVGCNQAMAIFLPGKMLGPYYDQMNVPRTWLARNISDWGVVMSALIPWNLHSLLLSAALGISVMQFAPYAALLYLLPIASLVRNIYAGNNFREEKNASASNVI